MDSLLVYFLLERYGTHSQVPCPATVRTMKRATYSAHRIGGCDCGVLVVPAGVSMLYVAEYDMRRASLIAVTRSQHKRTTTFDVASTTTMGKVVGGLGLVEMASMTKPNRYEA